MRRKQKYKFTEKTLSRRGMTALGLAVASLAALGIMIFLAFKSAGNLSVYIACYGILAMIAAVSGVVLAILSLREEDTFRSIPWGALVLSILAVLSWGGVYIGGMLL
ncbi:MAG: hypothetical protein K2O73_03195 [Lachnospiraceae bacterium]|nr:hypothetical protein [Lachnospiraceae bacterium]